MICCFVYIHMRLGGGGLARPPAAAALPLLLCWPVGGSWTRAVLLLSIYVCMYSWPSFLPPSSDGEDLGQVAGHGVDGDHHGLHQLVAVARLPPPPAAPRGVVPGLGLAIQPVGRERRTEPQHHPDTNQPPSQSVNQAGGRQGLYHMSLLLWALLVLTRCRVRGGVGRGGRGRRTGGPGR